jgi:hypothetical protein
MGKGLLAWWRRRIVARGLAGAVLFAVPVAVAALIGFGTSLSGVAGGLSAVTSGPEAVPTANRTTTPRKLNRAVVALASRQTSPVPSSAGGSTGGGGGATGGGGSTGTGTGTTGGGVSTGTGGGSGTSSSPIISAPSTPSTPSTPSAPSVTLPGGGGSTDVTNSVDSTVNNVVSGVNNTLNGLLGQ